jgi:hypothetical protein
MTDLTQATIKLVFKIGAVTQSELEFTDIFVISNNIFSDLAIQVILAHFSNGMYKIGRGWTASRSKDFSEVIRRQEIELSMIGADGEEIDLGCMVDNLRFHTKVIFRLFERLNGEATMIVRVNIFGKDDPADSKLDPNAHLALQQNVTALTGSGRVGVMGDRDKSSTNATTLPGGTTPEEIFSMQAQLNSKEFLKLYTLKCAAKLHLVSWYRDMCVHGSMWGVIVPPSFSLKSDYPMGLLWDKRFLGATVHATCGEMGRLLSKLLSNPLMFPKYPFGNVMNDNVSNEEGDDYACGSASHYVRGTSQPHGEGCRNHHPL